MCLLDAGLDDVALPLSLVYHFYSVFIRTIRTISGLHLHPRLRLRLRLRFGVGVHGSRAGGGPRKHPG